MANFRHFDDAVAANFYTVFCFYPWLESARTFSCGGGQKDHIFSGPVHRGSAGCPKQHLSGLLTGCSAASRSAARRISMRRTFRAISLPSSTRRERSRFGIGTARGARGTETTRSREIRNWRISTHLPTGAISMTARRICTISNPAIIIRNGNVLLMRMCMRIPIQV